MKNSAILAGMLLAALVIVESPRARPTPAVKQQPSRLVWPTATNTTVH